MSSSEYDQQKLNAALRWGIAFSVVWLAGIGSLIAMYLGLRGRRIITANPGLRGKGRAWWCIIVGGTGVALLVVLLAAGAFNAFSN